MRVSKKKPRHGRRGTSIALLESNPLAAEMIKSLLSRHNAYIEDYRSFGKLVESIGSSTAEIIVLDRGSFPQTTSETVRHLKDAAAAPILLVDETIPEADLCNFIHSGIKGFVSYCAVSESLFAAICSIVRGQPWFDVEIFQAYIEFVSNLNKRKSQCAMAFTERQTQIATLLKEGLSNKEIALRLAISGSTVKFHMAKLFAKLNIHDRRSVMKNDALSERTRMAETFQNSRTSRAELQVAIRSHLVKKRAG